MDKPRSFPLNAWYVAAWDHEIDRQLCARTICGKRLVMYRTSRGDVAALADACWHRLAPLSKGWLEDDEVVCGYHGLKFDAHGRCTHMPSEATVNPSAAVRAFPVALKHGFVWVWMGDGAAADPAAIPDMHWVNDPGWAGEGSTTHVACNYRLLIENLMDLTHETYVHRTSIGHSAITNAPFEVVHGERTVQMKRWMLDIDPPPFWSFQLGRPGRVDRWQIINFEPPAAIVLDVGVALAGTGAPQGDRAQGVTGRVCHFITPETESSSHFFWIVRRNYELDDAKLTIETRERNAAIVAEDVSMLTAQQRTMEENPNAVLSNLNIDGGAVWARRLIDRMIQAELAAAGARAAE
ncbi:MAG TPA: aromatic ring-hydroxylating dioxygenase subunit alpha [Alphaproteobacteria bacterium]